MQLHMFYQGLSSQEELVTQGTGCCIGTRAYESRVLLQHVSAQFDFLCAAADAHVIETVIPLSLWKTEEVKNNSNKLRNHFARGKRPVMPVLAMSRDLQRFFFINYQAHLMIVSLTSLVAAYQSNQDQISRRPYTYFKPNIIWSLFQNTLNSDVNLYESACPLCGKPGQNRCD